MKEGGLFVFILFFWKHLLCFFRILICKILVYYRLLPLGFYTPKRFVLKCHLTPRYHIQRHCQKPERFRTHKRHRTP